MTTTHHTAATRYIDVNGTRFAYRRWGKAGSTPLVLNHQYTATMDYWDPAMTDALASEREIILFNNTGVSSTTGEVPASVEAMATNAIAFIRALALDQVDVMGFSLGGMVAQEMAQQAPDLVRRLVLVSTGPRGGAGMENFTPEAQAIFQASYSEPDEIWLAINFHASPASLAAGQAYLQRFRLRQTDRDPMASGQAAQAQAGALLKWGGTPETGFGYLGKILQPTLVVAGGRDIIIYPMNAFILQQNLPNAQLLVYPDANHAPHYQYPEQFAQQLHIFLGN